MNQAQHINIATYLDDMGRAQPHTLAIVFPDSRDRWGRVSYTHLTFGQLASESSCLARGLEEIGLKKGDRAVLMVKPSLDFFALTFALLKAGIVPVLIDPGIGPRYLKQCIHEAMPQGFIGIPKAIAAKKILGWGRGSIRHLVTVGRRLFWGGPTLEHVKEKGKSSEAYTIRTSSREEAAAIVFTSGSTGVPKGVIYTHGNFIAQLEMIRETYQIKPKEIDLPTFPLFALFNPALGMTTIVPDMDPTKPALVDPRKIIEAVENFGVTNMFGSPALVDRVGRYGQAQGVKLPSLKRVISAGAPVPARALKRFSSMLSDDAQIFTPYGATESLPVCSIGSHQILRTETQERSTQGAGVCVGRPVENMKVSIIKITDEPIESWSEELLAPTGQVGEIVVQGPNVTRSYFNRKHSTALAKIVETDSDLFRHRMGDLGYFDEKGELWFCGRKSHRVQTPQESLFSVKCEAIFNVHPQVFRTALVGIGSDGKKEPVLIVELEKEGSPDRDQIKSELLELGQRYKETQSIKRLLFHASFPVDIRHNSKIFREKLAVWAQREIR